MSQTTSNGTGASRDHAAIIQAAASNPRHTTVTLPAVDVNAVLAAHYTPAGVRLTRTQLWDMEERKAKNPALYLGEQIIRPGSQQVFPSEQHGKYEDFVRIAEHHPWMDPKSWHTVIESVRLDHEAQLALFVGEKEYVTSDGTRFQGGNSQPLFHVSHGVEGTEEQPLNTWSITLLTEEKDENLVKFFEGMGKNPYLKYFVEVYIREVLGIDLQRKA